MIQELIEQVLGGDHPRDVINSIVEEDRGLVAEIPYSSVFDKRNKFVYKYVKDENVYKITYTGNVGDQPNFFGSFKLEKQAKEEAERLNKHHQDIRRFHQFKEEPSKKKIVKEPVVRRKKKRPSFKELDRIEQSVRRSGKKSNRIAFDAIKSMFQGQDPDDPTNTKYWHDPIIAKKAYTVIVNALEGKF